MYGRAVISATMLAMIYLLLMLSLPTCTACSEGNKRPQHVNYMTTAPTLGNVYDKSHGNFNYRGNNSWTKYSSPCSSSLCHELLHIPWPLWSLYLRIPTSSGHSQDLYLRCDTSEAQYKWFSQPQWQGSPVKLRQYQPMFFSTCCGLQQRPTIYMETSFMPSAIADIPPPYDGKRSNGLILSQMQ